MTILDSPSAATPLDVERFPTAVLPKAVTPLSGNELMAILQSGTNVYVGVSDFLAALTGGGGNFSAGVSDLGNTQGQTGMNTKRLVLAGLAALTLSQATDALGATVSFNAPVQSEQTQNLFDLTLGGNTAGAGALVSSGTLTLAGGANITLSQAGNAITVQGAAGGAGFSAGVSNLGNTSGSTGATGTRLVLAGGNSVTLSQSTDANGATVTISGATTPAQTAESQTFGMSNLGNTAGTSGVISGPQLRMLLAGGPNVTLSQSINASSATVSFSVAAQSAESQSAGISNLGNTSGTSGIASGAQLRLLLAGGNNITLSQSLNGASATITISAFNQSVQTQNLFALTISSNTAGAGALISSGTLSLAGGANITLSQNAGNAITIIGPSPSGGAFSAGVSNLGNTAGSTGISGTQLVLVGTNAISLSQSTGANGATVSINFTQSVQTQGQMSAGVSNLGNTAGSTGVSGTRMVLVGTNGISLSQSTDANGNTVSINFTQSAESNTLGMSNLGNTAGTSGVISGNQLRLLLAGGNNITLSQSINGSSATITISAFNQSVQTQGQFSAGASNLGNTAGATGVSGTRMVLVGSNNITLSQTTDANGNTVSILGAGGGAAGSNTLGISNLGNTSGTSGVISGSQLQFILAGGNNITLSQSINGSSATVTISAFNQSAESQSIGASNLGNTLGTSGVASGAQVRAVIIGTSNITVSQSVNGASATLSLIGQPSFSAGVSNLGNSAGATGISGTRLVLVGTNNITLSQTTDANGATISISGAAGGGGGNFSAGVSTLGNTAGSTGVTGTRLVFAGLDAVSLSQSTDANGGTISIDALRPNIGISTDGNTAGTSGAIFNVNRYVFVGSNGITLSQSTAGAGVASGTLSIFGNPAFSGGLSNLGNTGGATGITGTRLVFVGSNNITLSQTTDANGGTISLFGPAPAGGNFSAGVSTLGNTAGNTGTVSNQIVFAGINGVTLSQSTDAGGASVSFSGDQYTLADYENFPRLTMNNIVNMTAIQGTLLFFPFEVGGALTWNKLLLEASRATSGSNFFNLLFAIYTSVNSTQLSRYFSTSYQFTHSDTASVSGIRIIQATFATSLATAASMTPGLYYAAMKFVAGNNSTNTASMNYSLRGAATAGLPVGMIGQGNVSRVTTATSQLSSQPLRAFWGYFSSTNTDFSTAPASIAITDMRQFTTGVLPWMGLGGIT